jgi:hypothetical protein
MITEKPTSTVTSVAVDRLSSVGLNELVSFDCSGRGSSTLDPSNTPLHSTGAGPFLTQDCIVTDNHYNFLGALAMLIVTGSKHLAKKIFNWTGKIANES